MSGTRLATSILAALTLASCASGTASRPPATAASASMQPGAIVWRDLATEDVAASRRFYGQLLGWQFEDSERMGRPYVLATLGGDYVAGMVQITDQTPGRPESQWLSFMSVADVDRAVGQVEQAGGSVLVAPVTLERTGRVAVVADPQRAPVGLVRLAAGDPPSPDVPLAGRFFWSEYLASDAGRALEFYRGLAGYTDEVTEERGGMRYHVLRTGRPRAGLFAIPSTVTDVKPNWLPYIMVADPAGMAARAEQLGGRVLLRPNPDARAGTLAIVADPTGAAVALQKWPIS
jgi:predicted enzyme related to lactoylglutathione lyase